MGTQGSLVFSYLTLRKAIGLLGMAFPFAVSVGAILIFHTGLQGSISAYYHTGMRDVFVGVLFAIGFFLLSYRGHERIDDIAGDLGCLFAVGTALFRTTPDRMTAGGTDGVGLLHLICAGLFFLTLIYFSLFLFTKTHPDRPPTRRKLQRNKVYRACGYAMIACIGLIVIYFLLPLVTAARLAPYRPVFWLEAFAIVAFGVSWLVKGEAILRDED